MYNPEPAWFSNFSFIPGWLSFLDNTMKLQKIFDIIFNDPIDSTQWDDVKAQSFTCNDKGDRIGCEDEKNTEETAGLNEQKEFT